MASVRSLFLIVMSFCVLYIPVCCSQDGVDLPEQTEQMLAVEEKTNEAPVQQEPEQPLEDALDTIDVEDGGNWLIKRQAVEGMIDIIEQIDTLFTKIIESRFEFLVQRNQANKEFDLFAQTIGFDLGSLDQLLSTLFDHLAKERTQEGDLSEDERELQQSMQEQKKELETIQDAAQKIMARDAKIDESVMSIEQQINVARSYQNQAWRNFQAVKMVWSEEKAQELYQKTEALLNNLRQIYQTWLKGDLQRYVTELIQSSRADMQKIKDKMQTLKDKGIDLKEQAARVEAEETVDQKEESAQQLREKLEKEQREAQKARQGFFARIFSLITAPFSWVWSGIKWLFGMK